jgi:hypothetical protein
LRNFYLTTSWNQLICIWGNHLHLELTCNWNQLIMPKGKYQEKNQEFHKCLGKIICNDVIFDNTYLTFSKMHDINIALQFNINRWIFSILMTGNIEPQINEIPPKKKRTPIFSLVDLHFLKYTQLFFFFKFCQ